MLRRFLLGAKHFLSALFADKACSGCIARDYHIASLKEELRDARATNDLLHNDISELLKHVTGMNRVQAQPSGEVHSVSRTRNSIQSRIARAEAADRKESLELTEQRRKEYDERISTLMKPEIEVEENAVQEDGTKSIQEPIGEEIH